MNYPLIWAIGRLSIPVCPCCKTYLSDVRCFNVVIKHKTKPESRIGEYRLLFCKKCGLPFTTTELSEQNGFEYDNYCLPEFSCDSSHSLRYIRNCMKIPNEKHKKTLKTTINQTGSIENTPDNTSLRNQKSGKTQAANPQIECLAIEKNQQRLAEYTSAMLMLIFYEKGIYCNYIIVNDSREADLDNKVLHYSNGKARTLLTIAFIPQSRIRYQAEWKDVKFHSVVYKKGNQLTAPIIRKEIIIRKDGGFYEKHKSVSEVVNALLYSPYTGRLELIRTSYDKARNEYYIDPIHLRRFVDSYGNPGIPIRFIGSSSGTGYYDLNDQSILNVYGYNVSQNDGLSASERQAILTELVDLGIITISDIIRYLDFFIGSHPGDQYYYARCKWEDDREFISNYKANPSRFIIGGKIHK